MKSHASMNRIYRLVWNAAIGLWVAVAENAKGRSKGGSGRSHVEFTSVPFGSPGSMGGPGGFRLNRTCRGILLLVASIPHLLMPVYAADAANAAVTAGAGTVSTSGNTTTINQATQRLAIDWTSLSTAAGEALVFNQPNAQAIALNRIIGSSPSEMLGSLTANGQVFILNPNGVLFGAGSQVNVGGLVASTLGLSNADFMAGNHSFSGSGGGSVVNQGTMNAAPGGYLALLAPEVRNEGVMTASLGTALLAAGNKVTLNLDNGSLLGYSIDQGAVNALAENKQLIKADGGQVLLSAKAMDNLTTATVNNTGVIEARTIQNKGGRILLMGDMETGTVNVGGTLDASAPNGGDGGFVETSAAHVKVARGTKVTTEAANGKTGKWLIDPNDFTISATGDMDAATVAANLATTDFEIQTASMGTAGNGDITVDEAVSWAGPRTLTLTAQRHVNINEDISNSGSGAAGFIASGGGDINLASGVQVAATGGGMLAVNLGGASVNMASGSSIVTGGGAVTLAASNTAVQDAVKLDTATINAGAGTVSITGNTSNGGSTTDWSARGIQATGSTISGGNITLQSTNAAIQLLGTSVTSAGGNVLIDASGPSDTHSLEIAKNGATSSNVTTTGSGTMTLRGNLTAGGGSATGTAGGVVVTGSTISAGSGLITITGDAGLTGTVAALARGVRLDSGAMVTGAGNISITGRTGTGVQSDYGTESAGLEVKSGAKVISTAGNLVVSGTFNKPSAWGGKGAIIGGRLESGPAGSISITGNATVGGAGGTAVDLLASGVVIAGTGGLTAVSTVSSSTTATAIISSQINGTVSSTGNVAITGNISAPSASGTKGVEVVGTVTAIGGGNITITGLGVPAPAPAGNYNVTNFGTISSNGGTITLVGDRMRIDNSVNAGTGRIVIAPNNNGQPITLGGFVETGRLNLSNSELNFLTAATVQIGKSIDNGGIDLVGNVTTPNIGTLSLVNSSSSGSITQSGGVITVSKLVADARTVALTAANAIGTLSGRSYGGSFQVTGGGNAMTIGTVDGIVGINAGSQAVAITNGGDINADDGITTTGNVGLTSSNGNLNLKTVSGNAVTLSAANGAINDTNGTANNITATTLTATSSNGITLGTNVSGMQNLTTTGAAAAINIATANAINLANYTISTAAGTHQNVSLTTGHASGITGIGNAFAASDDNISLTATSGGINLDGNISAEGLTLSANGTITAPHDINVAGVFDLKAGAMLQTGTLPLFYANDFRISGGTFMRAVAGDGLSTASPYQINDIYGLQGMGSAGMLDKNFKLVDNLYAGGTSCWNACSGSFHGFKPIGDASTPFTGTFDGNNKVIDNLFINRAATSNVALFGYTGAGSSITSIGLTDVDITGAGAVGALIGNSDGGSVSNSYATGTVHGVSNVGGLVGDSSSDISGSYASVAVTASGSTAGGLVGYTDGSISNSYASGAVAAGSAAGGLAGGNAGAVTASFWDTTTSGQAASAGGTGKTSVQMMQAATFTGAGWSASNIGGDGTTWRIYEGQTGPLLRSFMIGVLNIADTTLTYNGSTQTGASNATPGLQGAVASGRNAGSYTGYYDDQQGYDIVGGNLTIGKASLTLAAVADTKTYDATALSTAAVSKTGLQGADTVTSLSQSFGSKNVLGAGGSALTVNAGYTVNDGNGGNNYNVSTAGAAGTINAASLTLAAVTDTKTYDATLTSGGTVVKTGLQGADTVTSLSQSFGSKNVLGANGSTLTVNAGYTVNDGNGGNNYNVSTAGAAGTINAASLTLAAVSDTRTYDATQASAGTVVKTGLIGGDTVTSLSQEFASKNVLGANGSSLNVKAGYVVNDGNGGNNYSVSTTAATGTINAASLTLAAVSDTRTYDATQASAGTVVKTGLQGADTVTSLSQSFGSKNVLGAGGSALTVNAGYSVNDGNGGNNYSVSTTAATGTINAASLTLAAVSDTRTYDATQASAGTVVKTGLQGADTVTSLSQSFGSKNVLGAGGSTLTVNAGYSVNDGNGGNNYSVSTTAATGTINAASLTLAAVSDTRTYDATQASAGTVVKTGLQGADTVTSLSQSFGSKNVLGANGSTLTVNAGYSVNDGNGGNNYSVSTTAATGTINKAVLNVVAAPDDKVYDGTTSATIGLTDNRFAGDVITLNGTANFASKDVGSGLAVTVGTLTPGGADAGNYTISVSSGGNTAAITPKALTVTASDDSKNFDNTPYSGGRGVTYSGFVTGEGASVLSGTLAYSGDSQGATASGEYDIKPGGLMSGNYAIGFIEGTLTIKASDSAAAALGGPALVTAYGGALTAIGSLGASLGGGSGGGGGSSGGGAGGGGGGSSGGGAAAGGTDAGAALGAGTDAGGSGE